MRLRWFGHACFELVFDNGTVIVTDPFDASVGYPLPDVRATAVTSSHDHFDHNYVEGVKGDPQVIKGVGRYRVGGVDIKGIASFHDANRGQERGENTIFVFDDGNLKVAHLGDLGHELTASQLDLLGPVDVLLIPVGGFYTIGPEEAANVVESIKPKVVIPMHFKTEAIDFPIAPVDDFLAAMGINGRKIQANWVEIDPKDLEEEMVIYVLKYQD
ncbi:MAG TPA: MBL fold metallo-hydrolase [Clostridia bacterium]|nr:MBL fold metallo-hydrolase [Clostridia bacterium]